MKKIQMIGSDTWMTVIVMSVAMAGVVILCAHFFDGQMFQRAAETLLLLFTIIASVYIITFFLNLPVPGSDMGKEDNFREREKKFYEWGTRKLYQRSLGQDMPFSSVEALIESDQAGVSIGKIQESKNFLLNGLGKVWQSFNDTPKLISDYQPAGGNGCRSEHGLTPGHDDSKPVVVIPGYDVENVVTSLNGKEYGGWKMSFISSPAEYDFRSNMIRCGRYMMYDHQADMGMFVPLVQLNQADHGRDFHGEYGSKKDKKIIKMYRDGANVSRIAGAVFKNTNGRNTKKVRTVLERYGVV
jgi:hypothetical protein